MIGLLIIAIIGVVLWSSIRRPAPRVVHYERNDSTWCLDCSTPRVVNVNGRCGVCGSGSLVD